MTTTAFDAYVRSIHDRAADEARTDRSPTIEAHHLLLGIAAEPNPAPRRS